MNNFRIILTGVMLVFGVAALRLKIGEVDNASHSTFSNVLLVMLTICMLITLVLDIRAFKVSRNWANMIPSLIGLLIVTMIFR